jgi:DNA-directed RNA polymerase sigma subunit (sigma70/sigma32)
MSKSDLRSTIERFAANVRLGDGESYEKLSRLLSELSPLQEHVTRMRLGIRHNRTYSVEEVSSHLSLDPP